MPTTYAIPNGRTVMDVSLWTGTGAAANVTNQYGFKPDLVWGKMRNSADKHYVFNSISGVTKYLSTNVTDAETTDSTIISSLNSNGFTLGTSVDLNRTGGYNYVGWQWQAGQGTTSSNTNGSITSTVSVNATAGFSIVTYTGTQSAATVGHGLGAVPSMIIVRYTGLGNWQVYHSSIGNTQSILLNTTAAASSASSAFWNNTTPTSTVFSLGTSDETNHNGGTTVAYCWTPIPGFSQFGSYTGNGSADGPFVYTGFRPKFVMYKKSTGTGSWFMFDSSRNPYNSTNLWLQANTNEAEQTDGSIDILSNGFKQRASGGGSNTNGDTFVYMAFAENPFKYANAR